MQITIQCQHCGKPLRAASEMAGRKVKCSACDRDFVLPETLAATDLSSEFPTVKMALPRDDTLSRSMLPGLGKTALPPNEMRCRLEPGSLRLVGASETVEEFLDCPVERLRQRTLLDFLHPDDRALAEDEFRQAADLGERHDFVLRIPRAGQMLYVRVYAQARYDPDGRLNHIRCYLKDVTERVQAEQELRRRTEQLTTANERLRQANERLKEAQSQLVHSEKLAALGTLAAGMAHEINNPLAFAMNNVAVLEREIGHLLRIIAGYHEGRDDLAKLRPELGARIAALEEEADLTYLLGNLGRMTQSTRQGLGRVAKIVENLRGFARLDSSSIGLIDVNQAIEQSLNMLADALAQQRIRVVRDLGDVPPLEGAGADLNQVFLNLIMNAMQAVEAAGKPEGRIEVRTRRDDADVLVEVTDDGCGIPADVIPRIFDPFFTTKPVGRGTGLGLSIGHGIIAKHGGRIEVESTHGAGSCFRVRLPVRRVGWTAETAAEVEA